VICEYIKAAIDSGFTTIAGVDEVGRGPLAGPVVAAACILPSTFSHPLLRDSKKLSPLQRRTVMEALLLEPNFEFAIGMRSPEEIDEQNILQASLHAMLIAIADLPVLPDYLLIDGNQKPNTDIPCDLIIKGDDKCPAIAAASILAKETRDAIMLEYHEKWPQYNFASHKGYPTKAHLAALDEHGILPIHRKSFAPIRLRNT
jgi:ribonuclease HII